MPNLWKRMRMRGEENMKRMRMRAEERGKIRQRVRMQRIESEGIKKTLRQRLTPVFIRRSQARRAETLATTKQIVREVKQTEERARKTKVFLRGMRLLPKVQKATNMMKWELNTLANNMAKSRPAERVILSERMAKVTKQLSANQLWMERLKEAQ